MQVYITMDCLAVVSSCHNLADWDDLQTLKWAQTVDPHQSEECELLLETYSMQVGCHAASQSFFFAMFLISCCKRFICRQISPDYK